MLKKTTTPQELPACIAVLGMFDGVHMGHRRLLETGRAMADRMQVSVAVVTFEPHPLAVLFPERKPPRLTTAEERERLFEACGADIACVMPFTRELASQQPGDFVQHLCGSGNVRGIVCGYNFTFGDRGKGNTDLLSQLSGKYGYELQVVPEVRYGEGTVSSTVIRKLIDQGKTEEANTLLCRSYEISGTVVHGRGLGHTLGFATVNLDFDPEKVLPRFGVHFCKAEVTTQNGERFQANAVINVGRHPTVPGHSVTIEAHLLGINKELYGAYVTLRFLHFSRDERKFNSIDELKQCVDQDKINAAEYFGN